MRCGAADRFLSIPGHGRYRPAKCARRLGRGDCGNGQTSRSTPSLNATRRRFPSSGSTLVLEASAQNRLKWFD